MHTKREKQAYLDAFAKNRGYAHRMHRVLANCDLDVFKAINPLPYTVYAEQRSLGNREKELMLVLSFTCLRTDRYIIASHIRKALAFGATPRQVLETLELCVLDAGRAAFEDGVLALAAVAPPATWTNTKEQSMKARKAARRSRKKAAAHAPMAFEPVLEKLDPVVLELIRRYPGAVYDKERTLDAKTKALISVVMMTTLKVPNYLLKAHISKALQIGATEQEILEAIQMIITVTGLPTFEYGLMAWADVVGAKELRPKGAVYSKLS